MDIDKGASLRKGKGKARARAAELEEREGTAQCGGCAGRRSRCWVDPAWIKKWKETVAHGSGVQGVLGQEAEVLPAGVVEGAGCVETRVEEEARRGGAGRDREDEPRASGSGVKAGGTGERGDKAPKKKQRVEVVAPPRPKEKDAPQAAKERDPGPDIVTALVNINNSVAALVRAVTESNDYLWVISEYMDRLAWGGVEDESDEGSEEWDSGGEEVVCGADKNIAK